MHSEHILSEQASLNSISTRKINSYPPGLPSNLILISYKLV